MLYSIVKKFQVYVRCFSKPLRVHHPLHVRNPTDIQCLAMFLLYIYSNSINCFNYSNVQIINVSNFGLVTISFTQPHRKKSNGVILGKLGGHGMGPSRPIHLSGNVSFKN